MTAALRRPAAAGVLVALVLLGGWWKLMWQPQGDALAAAHRETLAAATNLITVEQSVGRMKHLQVISPQMASLEKKLSAAAPTTDSVDQFLLTLNDLGLQNGVTVGLELPNELGSDKTGRARDENPQACSRGH